MVVHRPAVKGFLKEILFLIDSKFTEHEITEEVN